MEREIWSPQVYQFLEFIAHASQGDAPHLEKKILDCGAGGEHPPLGLFYEHGYEAWGIDISEERIAQTRAFAEARGMALHLQHGDMREMPFDDESFSYVYEFYSICHLSKQDTGRAIGEMTRVLRKGGLCYVGFMSADCWPIIGREVGVGEFYLKEGDHEVIHSIYADDEPDGYFAGLEILVKEKRATQFRRQFANATLEKWESFYQEGMMSCSRDEWAQMYAERLARGNYTHLYYIVRKPI